MQQHRLIRTAINRLIRYDFASRLHTTVCVILDYETSFLQINEYRFRCLKRTYYLIYNYCLQNRSMSSSSASTSSNNDAIISSVGNKRTIVLNRPKAMNALNLNMINIIYPALLVCDTLSLFNSHTIRSKTNVFVPRSTIYHFVY